MRTPPAPGAVSTGAVIGIFSAGGAAATGAVIAIFSALAFAPAM